MGATETTGEDSTDDYGRRARKERLVRAWRRLSSNTLTVVGLLMLLTVFLAAVFAPELAPYPEDASGAIHFDQASQPPSWEHPMGTDTNGRDIFSRVLFGARISLMMAAVVLTIGVGIGVPLGLVAGYFGGRVNALIMRTTDVFLAIPPIVLALAITAAVEPSLRNAMIAVAFAWWPWYVRLTQGEVLSVKEETYVEASESIGTKWPRVIRKEILPNIIAPLSVKITLDAGFVILVGAGLAFLGLGAQPPTADWGAMVADGRDNVTNFWWIATMPGLAISFTVLGFNMVGDGLRDLFDVEVDDV